LGVFRASAFAGIPSQGAADLAELYGRLLADGQLAGFEVRQRFYEIGSFQGIEELSALLARQEATTE
jgi:NDP-sugar pyrophosphorylase family protein